MTPALIRFDLAVFIFATRLAYALDTQPLHQTVLNPYASAFLLLGALHALLLVSALMLPPR